jgi:hypothetical protein
MDKWRVGDDTGSKETDGCPLTGKCFVLFLLDYIFTLDFPWLDLSRVISLSQ